MVDLTVNARQTGTTVPPNDLYLQIDSATAVPYVAIRGIASVNGSLPVSSAGTLAVEQALSIANGASVSTGQIDLAGLTPVGLWTPSAWTAASITFQASRDGGATWGDVFDDLGAEIAIPSASIPSAAQRRFSLNPRIFLGMSLLRIRSGTSAAPVNQGATRSLTLIIRAIL